MFKPEIIEKFRQIHTPFYYYDMEVLNATIGRCIFEAEQYGFHLHYALKANSNPKILQILSNSGFGADCVSGNEVKAALENGFQADQIVFAGVGKTDDELRLALQNGIQSINVESIQEMEVINELASLMGEKARISLRIIPNIDAHTHRHITTGLEENKFGILPWQFDEVLEKLRIFDKLELCGLHFHIGSQITDLDVFKSLCKRVNEINTWFMEQGYPADIINVGGGLGVDYSQPDKWSIPDFASYFRVFHDLSLIHI